MRFASTWGRGAVRASAVTLLVPASIIIPLAVAQLGGGLRGLGAAGQLLHGPDVPALPATGSAHAREPRGGAPAVALPVVRGGGTVAPAVQRGSGTVTRTSAPPTRAPAAAPGRDPVATGGLPHPGRRPSHNPAPGTPKPPAQSSTPTTAPAAAPPSTPAPAPQPRTDPVRQTGEAVAGVVGTLPAPVGPAGQDAVTTVIDIVDPPGN